MQEREIRQAQSGEIAEDFPLRTELTTRRGEPWFAQITLFLTRLFGAEEENRTTKTRGSVEAKTRIGLC
jgi:hypothetical protein